jgi:hypothetical protein
MAGWQVLGRQSRFAVSHTSNDDVANCRAPVVLLAQESTRIFVPTNPPNTLNHGNTRLEPLVSLEETGSKVVQKQPNPG